MDFERIYERFTAAKASGDLATMSDIIAQVNSFCAESVNVLCLHGRRLHGL